LRARLNHEVGFRIHSAIVHAHHLRKRHCHLRARWSFYLPAWWYFVTNSFNPHLETASRVHALVSTTAPSWLLVEPSDGYTLFSINCELSREKETLSWLAVSFLNEIEPELFRLRQTLPALAQSKSKAAASATQRSRPSAPTFSGIASINPKHSGDYVARVLARTYRVRLEDVRIYHPDLARNMEVIALEIRRTVLTHDLHMAQTRDDRTTIEYELAEIAAALSKRVNQKVGSDEKLKSDHGYASDCHRIIDGSGLGFPA